MNTKFLEWKQNQSLDKLILSQDNIILNENQLKLDTKRLNRTKYKLLKYDINKRNKTKIFTGLKKRLFINDSFLISSSFIKNVDICFNLLIFTNVGLSLISDIIQTSKLLINNENKPLKAENFKENFSTHYNLYDYINIILIVIVNCFLIMKYIIKFRKRKLKIPSEEPINNSRFILIFIVQFATLSYNSMIFEGLFFDINLNSEKTEVIEFYKIKYFTNILYLLKLKFNFEFLLKNSKWKSHAIRSYLYRKKEFIVSKTFILKSFLYEYKILFMIILMALVILFTSVQVYILDSFIFNIDNYTNYFELTQTNLIDSIWMVYVTCSTLGYGDYYPKGIISKIYIIFSSIIGFLIISILIYYCQNSLNLTGVELKSYRKLKINVEKEKVTRSASEVIKTLIRFHKLLRNKNRIQYLENVTKINFLNDFSEFDFYEKKFYLFVRFYNKIYYLSELSRKNMDFQKIRRIYNSFPTFIEEYKTRFQDSLFTYYTYFDDYLFKKLDTCNSEIKGMVESYEINKLKLKNINRMQKILLMKLK